jgi:hypothetical protein
MQKLRHGVDCLAEEQSYEHVTCSIFEHVTAEPQALLLSHNICHRSGGEQGR